MFRVSQHPSSGVLKTVAAASGTGHNTGTATSFQLGLIGKESRSGFAINKYLHTVASGWIFIHIYNNISHNKLKTRIFSLL